MSSRRSSRGTEHQGLHAVTCPSATARQQRQLVLQAVREILQLRLRASVTPSEYRNSTSPGPARSPRVLGSASGNSPAGCRRRLASATRPSWRHHAGPGCPELAELASLRRPPSAARAAHAVTNRPSYSWLSSSSFVLASTSAGIGVPVRDGPDRVPGGRGHRGGSRPCRTRRRRDGPAARGAEHVVEVAADLEPFAGRDVGGGQLGAGDVGQLAGEQAGLQRVGHGRTAAEHPVDPDGHASCSPSSSTRPRSAISKCRSSPRPGQSQDAVAGSPSVSGTLSSEVAPSCMSSGTPSGPVPRMPRSSGVRQQHRAAGVVHLAGTDPGCGSTPPTAWRSARRSPGGPITTWRRSRSGAPRPRSPSRPVRRPAAGRSAAG